MIKNVLPSLRQGGGPQRICSRQKSIRSGTARDSFSQTPHTRGKDPTRWRCGRRSRITPAHAGKSASNHLAFHHLRDHPRTCGEKRVLSSSSFAKMGSPPHMRGKVLRTCGRCGCPRDHPRVCGEKLMAAEQLGRTAGSPPHVRGKVGQLENHKMVVGITPACAGKSLIESCGNAGKKGHPRACGEKYRENTEAMRVQGSPPHMRGKDPADLQSDF